MFYITTHNMNRLNQIILGVTVDELGLERTLVTDHLEELERLLNGISVLKDFCCIFE
ncbi:hypothetical protein HanHA300_Chr07g0248191 [Helianthus annuus]|nr:hypothetical protein HanHA300_Chr07g0248191 [Helianthus annuus]KAJ0563600.1 hypothetical protein HanHA89_Chr07g0264941 [Helianthus annuus]KAJ0728935.1 hypothetical protein HanLR1_Chr07g0247281 [Helianthus annuus]KAJ0731690.1 hypothetical protein HanOQP8_Chr07g0254821 [Helianthus annuus]